MAITVNGAAGATSITQLSVGTSADLASIISNESGTGVLAFTNTPTLVTPILGTPQSVTLTNATGLPVSGITASTATALGVGSIELGHATDTTIARSGAGVVTIEGVQVVTLSSADTLTNKTISAGTLTGTLTAGGSAGTAGQVLTSTGTGVQYTTLSAGTTANDQAFAFAVQVFA